MFDISASPFENRYRPQEITPAVRRRMAVTEWKTEIIWLCCGIVLTAAFGLFLSLTYRIFGEPQKAEVPLIIGWVVIALAFLSALHWQFHTHRKFIREMPAAAAVISAVEILPEFSDEGAGHIEKLTIEYLPGEVEPHPERLRNGSTVHTSARVGQVWTPFVEHLHEGEFVSVLYDPTHPNRVRVVEEEHELAL